MSLCACWPPFSSLTIPFHYIHHSPQIAIVVKAFKYPADTALAVGLNLSQIGEFVFVLLSMASQQSLLPESVYMLMMGERGLLPLFFAAHLA